MSVKVYLLERYVCFELLYVFTDHHSHVLAFKRLCFLPREESFYPCIILPFLANPSGLSLKLTRKK